MGRRTNGFQKPFHKMQIGTWLLLPILLLQFLFFATPILPLAVAIILTAIVFMCGLCTAYFTYKCCVIDPIDERLRCHLADQYDDTCDSQNQSSTLGADTKQEDDLTKFCWLCKIDVDELSMHCKFCDKCVSRFDHHCHWLNTCIGKSNYEYFFRTVGFTLAMVLFHGGALAGLVISFFIQYASQKRSGGEFEDDSTLGRSNDWFDLDAGLVIAIVNTVFLAVDIACTSLLGQLFLFHIRLRREKITTYAYIVRDGERKHQAARLKMEMGRNRIIAIGEANKERNLMRKFFLKAAGCSFIGELVCKPCDPLRMDEKKNKAQPANVSDEFVVSDDAYDGKRKSSFEREEQSITVELGECPPSRSCAHNDEQSNPLNEIKHDKEDPITDTNMHALDQAMEHRRESLQENDTEKKGVEFISISAS